MGVKFLIQKYERPSIDRVEVTGLLESFRRSIGEKRTVLDAGFSYADILIATALQMVKPVSKSIGRLGQRHGRLGPFTNTSMMPESYCSGEMSSLMLIVLRRAKNSKALKLWLELQRKLSDRRGIEFFYIGGQRLGIVGQLKACPNRCVLVHFHAEARFVVDP